ncbi:hypothetical protein OAA09_01080 [bacterium]|nr:hypothetical protein [bacterium]
MKKGDLVRLRDEEVHSWKLHENKPIETGIIIDFVVNVDRHFEPVERMAVVFWNDKFPAEEEYLSSLAIVSP